MLVAFAAFVHWNGSVVLGTSAILLSLIGSCLPFFNLVVMKCLPLTPSLDISGAKEAHAVSPHFAQIMYFSLVASLAMAPWHFSSGQAADMFWSFWKNQPLSFFQGFMALTGGFLSVHFFR